MAAALTEQTLRDARARKPAALRELYDDFAPGILGYLRSKGCEDPEGLTQEVFLTLFAKLDSLSGGLRGARTFAFSVAHARMVDDIRRREREPATAVFDPELDGRSTQSAEESALGADTGVASLLQGLTPQQQEVLLLRVVADLSIDESAKIMGRTPGAVKQLQRRALGILKGQLEGKEAPDNERAS
ncbi:sigma-70 family RNA polymerase sigma factor [Arthrobacter sp. zg-Y40]|uniref:RNA polymerase sigma factor n=1 Tax=unclassified Arthrobacter TaxID=235627 RepID=UPI001D154C5B|nr:sigma-70 family RNA polymerase sigma factor [Arthrobacter sp. zg-Y1143]MCC3278868.1 sigma-70 family RNA polymerase sigma factor [Arthrobacter sp. zg-Y40]MDK1326060.1 sigma-70 family RNA polymerase sigma factor [Arthrobacter sp. zg-Y1143]